MPIANDSRKKKIEYDKNGISQYELLPGVYNGGIRSYRYNLRAGSHVSPELYADKTVILFFGMGAGYITDATDAYTVDEPVSFYIPNFDKTPYTIYATEDMEFIFNVVDMNEWDKEAYEASHARLPLFLPLSKCTIYDQDCKSDGTSSWNVLQPRQLGRIICGVVRSPNGGGTTEKGHPAVHQWNYILGNSDFNLTVKDETIHTVAGDWSFVEAGDDHALVGDPGKEVFYVWFEHFAREKDFSIKPMPDFEREKVEHAVHVVRNEDIHVEYDQNGFYQTELLPGTYEGGVRNYKCFLKAGSEVSPELYKDQGVILMFGKGRGYIRSEKAVHNITELAFYVPEWDKTPYTIHAFEDMEYVCSVITFNEWDRELYNHIHIRLPFFRTISDAIIYDQDCKSEGTRSWWILSTREFGRVMVGVVRTDPSFGGGTREKGHLKVEQWNYCLGDSDFTLEVEGEDPVHHKGGEWSFVKAGYDHALISEKGKEAYYVWYEHHTREKDFSITPLKGEEITVRF